MSARAKDETRIVIELPLPMDVASTVISAIGAAYPSAQIDTRGSVGFGFQNRMVLVVDASDRARNFKRKAAAARLPSTDPDFEADLTAINDFEGESWSISTAPPEAVTAHLSDLCVRMLEQAGQNYIEWQVNDRTDPSKQWVLCVARSDGQTPHALRQAADARAEVAEAEVDQLRAALCAARAERDEALRERARRPGW